MIWVSSSAVLAVVCALSLFWVAPRLQRRRELPVEAPAETAGPDGLPAPIEQPPPASRRRRNIMATTDTVPRPADGDPGRTGRGHLRIRRDRAVILLAGCAALLAALVTAVVAPFSAAVSWPWPVFLLLLGVGAVLSLRYLAVQDRAARRASRPAVRAPEAEAEPHAPREDVALFDNEHVVAEEVREQSRRTAEDLDLPTPEEQPRMPAPAAFTVEELRAEALRVARESAPAAAARTWEPVPVPRPTYAEAPVVQRPEPEPLPVPEQPAARSASLKDAVRTGEEQGRAALDLDDVLKRRRA
ncbi:hypothetical protein [Kocuria rosea]|uniref:Uncharacterized protein n=1 Tax=Kocuria rosea subsp. polaris TaxID=136273 RepID=A0A0A6VTP0_KOCRO|nr:MULTISPECIES: hypothetical protein [Kocuria]KHD97996.1 hypothetical protein GY22_05380 [Kocuria polaris]